MLELESGYNLVQAGVILSIFSACGVVARIVWVWIADRIRSATDPMQKRDERTQKPLLKKMPA